jgi:hypothetical protein
MQKPLRTVFLSLGCVSLLLGLTLAAPVLADEVDPVLAARADFDQGRNGDDGAAIERAADEFKQLTVQTPGSPLLLAYYGSAVTLQARHAFAPWNKMRYAENGLDALDKALALLQPEHENQRLAGMSVALVTRLVAITTFVAMPGMFHRLDDAKDLLQQAYRSASFRSAPPRLVAAFAYQAALIARRDDKREVEIEQLRKVLELGPQSDEASKAAVRLKELSQ